MSREYQIPDHVKGDTWQGLTLKVRDSQGASLASKFASARMQLRTAYDDEAAAKEWTSPAGITLGDPDTDVTILPTVVDIPAGSYVYDIETTDIAGAVQTYLRGKWKIVEEVTR